PRPPIGPGFEAFHEHENSIETRIENLQRDPNGPLPGQDGTPTYDGKSPKKSPKKRVIRRTKSDVIPPVVVDRCAHTELQLLALARLIGASSLSAVDPGLSLTEKLAEVQQDFDLLNQHCTQLSIDYTDFRRRAQITRAEQLAAIAEAGRLARIGHDAAARDTVILHRRDEHLSLVISSSLVERHPIRRTTLDAAGLDPLAATVATALSCAPCDVDDLPFDWSRALLYAYHLDHPFGCSTNEIVAVFRTVEVRDAAALVFGEMGIDSLAHDGGKALISRVWAIQTSDSLNELGYHTKAQRAHKADDENDGPVGHWATAFYAFIEGEPELFHPSVYVGEVSATFPPNGDFPAALSPASVATCPYPPTVPHPDAPELSPFPPTPSPPPQEPFQSAFRPFVAAPAEADSSRTSLPARPRPASHTPASSSRLNTGARGTGNNQGQSTAVPGSNKRQRNDRRQDNRQPHDAPSQRKKHANGEGDLGPNVPNGERTDNGEGRGGKKERRQDRRREGKGKGRASQAVKVVTLNVTKLRQSDLRGPDFAVYFKTAKIIVLLETQTDEEGWRTFVFPPGWTLAVSSRPPRRNLTVAGAGLIVLVKDEIPVSLNLEHRDPDFIWLNVGDILLGCIYLQPETSGAHRGVDVSAFNAFTDAVSLRCGDASRKVLIVGDLNARLGNHQSCGPNRLTHNSRTPTGRGVQMLPLLRSHNLSILNGAVGRDLTSGGLCTSFHGGRTVIDVGIASLSLLPSIGDFFVHQESNTGKHCAIEVDVTIRLPDPLRVILAELPETAVHFAPCRDPREGPKGTVDELMEKIHDSLREQRLTSAAIPLSAEDAAQVAREQQERDDLRDVNRRLHLALLSAKSQPPDHLAHVGVRALRNEKATVRRRIKRNRRIQAWGKASRSNSHFWRLFRDRTKVATKLPLASGVTSGAPVIAQASATAFGAHYRDLLTPKTSENFVQATLDTATANLGHTGARLPLNHPLQRPLTVEEIEVAIKKRRKITKSSPGPDDATWAEVCSIPAETLRVLFQECLDKNSVPCSWKVAPIIPIGKKTTVPNDPSTFRGITLESCFLKMLTTLIYQRMEEWVEMENLLPDSQGGFRRRHRTENNMFILHAAIQRAQVDKKDVHVAFVDLQKAFDTVSRPLLWERLRALGAGGPMFAIIQTMYAELHTIVRTQGEDSPLFKAEIGVLQGDPLSGLLWDLFICKLALPVDEFSPRLNGTRVPHLEFCDDLALLSVGSREALQTRFNGLDKFVNNGHLTVSAPKQELPPPATLPTLTPAAAAEVSIVSNGIPLSKADSAKYLGLIFEGANPGKFREHLAATATKARSMAQCALALQYRSGLLPVPKALVFYNERIRSMLLFASAITFAIPVPEFEMLEKTFFRRTLGIPDTSSVAGTYLELGTFPIQMHRLENALKFYFYAASTTAPPLLRDALLDNMQIPVLGNSKNPTWFASLVHACEDYNLPAPPHLSGSQALDMSTPEGRASRQQFLRQLRRRATRRLHDKVGESVRYAELKNLRMKHRLQPYLVHNSFKNRNSMTRVRMSNHHLGIETGRHHRPPINPRSRRVCRLCDKDEIEDPRHALSSCDGTQNLVILRRTLMLNLGALPPDSLEITNLQALLHDSGSQDLWDRLLNASAKSVVTLVAPFIRKCLREFYELHPRYLPYTAPEATEVEIAAFRQLFGKFIADTSDKANLPLPHDGFVDSDIDSDVESTPDSSLED
ncbi:hypothetical protein P7C70_g5950, partial [Phenoliferia sp. Uapishka_3]